MFLSHRVTALSPALHTAAHFVILTWCVFFLAECICTDTLGAGREHADLSDSCVLISRGLSYSMNLSRQGSTYLLIFPDSLFFVQRASLPDGNPRVPQTVDHDAYHHSLLFGPIRRGGARTIPRTPTRWQEGTPSFPKLVSKPRHPNPLRLGQWQ